MSLFDAYIVVDWSAKGVPSPMRRSKDALWVGERVIEDNGARVCCSETYFRTRFDCINHVRDRLLEHKNFGRRVFIGFDFAYGYPAGFADACGIGGVGPSWSRVWDKLTDLIEDNSDNSNNRFAVADALNGRCQGMTPGPFWGCIPNTILPAPSPKGSKFPFQTSSGNVLECFRETEKILKSSQDHVKSVWQLWGAGAVGSQSMLGIPAVKKLRNDPELQHISQVWPFETEFDLPQVFQGTPFVLHAEIWPGVIKEPLDQGIIKDQAQVRAMVGWLAKLDALGELAPLFKKPAGLPNVSVATSIDQEGWIFGAGD